MAIALGGIVTINADQNGKLTKGQSMFYQRELTLDEIRTRAPSVYADGAKETNMEKKLLNVTGVQHD